MNKQIEVLKLAREALETCMYPQQKQLQALLAIDEALAQPEQEPVAWVVYSSAENDIVWADKGTRLKQNTPLYTTPPKQEPRNFCSRCGKRTADLTVIHTCTPPRGLEMT